MSLYTSNGDFENSVLNVNLTSTSCHTAKEAGSMNGTLPKVGRTIEFPRDPHLNLYGYLVAYVNPYMHNLVVTLGALLIVEVTVRGVLIVARFTLPNTETQWYTGTLMFAGALALVSGVIVAIVGTSLSVSNGVAGCPVFDSKNPRISNIYDLFIAQTLLALLGRVVDVMQHRAWRGDDKAGITLFSYDR